MRSALEQLEEERNIPKDKILSAIEDSLTAAYKRDYGKKGQIIRAKFDLDSGDVVFSQIKIVTDESMLKPEDDEEETKIDEENEEDERVRFNEEQHIMIDDARKIKKDAQPGEEIIFPLEKKDDFGRIAAQTAKQVIIQRIREAEKYSILDEFSGREGDVISGVVQKVERGNVYVDLGRTTAILPYEEQIRGEFYRHGERLRAYLYDVEETPRGITLRLSRSHPKFVEKLFELEVPEIATESVEIKMVAREAGSRTKIAVASADGSIDPVGSMVGQKGSRVSTVIGELGGEKIDIIEWSEDPKTFIANSLSPAKISAVELDEKERIAKVEVRGDQFSLAVGKGGQNVRLAAKLTGWKIDIDSPDVEEEAVSSEETDKIPENSDSSTEISTEDNIPNEENKE